MTSSSSCWELRDRLAGGLVGLLVGDAIGVPYEFHPPANLPAQADIDMVPPVGFRRAHFGVPPGTWSDDGAQALVLLDSLLANDDLDLAHFASGLRRWMLEGFCAVNRSVFDVGVQTSAAINRLQAGIPPESAGPDAEHSNGNGSLMRVLPLALWHKGDDLDLVRLAARQSLPTHGHMRSLVCCALYCLWTRGLLRDEADAWDWAVARLRSLAAEASLDATEVEKVVDPENAKAAAGSGYVLDTLWSARSAVLGSSDFVSCVRQAIAFGHDTDTTACVAGGIAGLIYGWAGIPLAWREGLRGGEILQPLLVNLLERHVPAEPDRSYKTSTSHPLRVDAFQAGQGEIGLTFCPGKHQDGAISGNWRRDLLTDIAVLRDWGASDVLTLIEPHEFVALKVEPLGAQVEAAGIRWHHLPIPDTQPPGDAFEAGWPDLSRHLIGALQAGGKVHIHCKGGLGRAGTVAALLLREVEPDLTLASALARIRKARQGAVETRQQVRYLERAWRLPVRT